MPAYEILAIVGFVLHAAVAIAALVSLHRALDSLTLGSVVFWFAFIVLSPLLGALVWFAFGKPSDKHKPTR